MVRTAFIRGRWPQLEMTKAIYILLLLLLVSCGKRIYPVVEERALVDKTLDLGQITSLTTNIDFFFANCKASKFENYGVAAVYANTLEDIKEGNYYINSSIYLSRIFGLPPSYYFMHNDRPVLVYTRKSGFANPNLYTQKQIELFSKHLMDDWNWYYQSTEKLEEPLPSWDGWYRGKSEAVIRHPDQLRVRDNAPEILKYFEFDAYNFTQPNENYDFYRDLAIEELRVKMKDTLYLN